METLVAAPSHIGRRLPTESPGIPTKLPHAGEAATKEASVEEEAVLIKGRNMTGGGWGGKKGERKPQHHCTSAVRNRT